MSKFKKTTKRMIIAALLLALVVSWVWVAVFSFIPPNQKKMERCFQQDEETLSVIITYLSSLDYSYISIDKTGIDKGVMFTGAGTRYQKIDDQNVLKSLNKILSNRKYMLIGKNNNTVFFQKWRFLEKDRGIAMTLSKEEPPWVEYLIKLEPLSKQGWYYYEADYEEYRKR